MGAVTEPPISLTGEMWWGNPADRKRTKEFLLRADGFSFVVAADNCSYRGNLIRRDDARYDGKFTSAYGLIQASCTLVESGGIYRLNGKWRQSDRKHPWHAELEPD